MAETVPSPPPLSKGRQRRVAVPPRFDKLDRPTWALPAPDGARWVEVPDGDGTDPTGYRRGFVSAFAPGLLLPATPRPTVSSAPGHPPLETTAARVRCQSVASAIDLREATARGLARAELTFGSEEARRQQTRRDYNAGRRSLCQEGVLPWAAWPDGRLPDGDWRKAPELMEALTEWAREAMRNPAPAPPTPLEEMATTLRAASVLAMVSPLLRIAETLRRDQRAADVPPWRYEDTLAAREEATARPATRAAAS